jgi:hypothetical protein
VNNDKDKVTIDKDFYKKEDYNKYFDGKDLSALKDKYVKDNPRRVLLSMMSPIDSC